MTGRLQGTMIQTDTVTATQPANVCAFPSAGKYSLSLVHLRVDLRLPVLQVVDDLADFFDRLVSHGLLLFTPRFRVMPAPAAICDTRAREMQNVSPISA